MNRVEILGASACAFLLAAGILVDLEWFGTALACVLISMGHIIAIGGMTA